MAVFLGKTHGGRLGCPIGIISLKEGEKRGKKAPKLAGKEGFGGTGFEKSRVSLKFFRKKSVLGVLAPGRGASRGRTGGNARFTPPMARIRGRAKAAGFWQRPPCKFASRSRSGGTGRCAKGCFMSDLSIGFVPCAFV